MQTKSLFYREITWSILLFVGLYLAFMSLYIIGIRVAPVFAESRSGLLLMQGLSSILVFAGTPLLTAKKLHLKFDFFNFTLPNALVLMWLALFIALACAPINALLADWGSHYSLPSFMHSLEESMREMDQLIQEQTEYLMTVHHIGGLFVLLFVMAFLPAVCEELFFRAWFQRVLTKRFGAISSIIFVAFFFSVIHFEASGFVARFLLGVVLGFLYYYTSSLFVPIIFHFTNNALAVIIYTVTKDSPEYSYLNTLGSGDTLWVAGVSVIVAAALFYWIWFVSSRTEQRVTA